MKRQYEETWDGEVVAALGGSELAARRKSAGYSREEFARLVGISPRTLEGWERDASKGVPSGKRELVELVLSRPRAEVTTLNLMALLTARLAAGEEAVRRLAELERLHPELFVKVTPEGEEGAEASPDSHRRSIVAESFSGEDVTRGQQGQPPRRRIRGVDDDD